MAQKRPYKRPRPKRPHLTTEQLVERFILRNSDNGYFTKISTISAKFDLSADMTWQMVGNLLGEEKIESRHDKFSGEMKLCGAGKASVLGSQRRKRHPRKAGRKPDDNLPAQCHPAPDGGSE